MLIQMKIVEIQREKVSKFLYFVLTDLIDEFSPIRQIKVELFP